MCFPRASPPATATIKLRPAGDHHADKAWTVTGTPYKIQLEKHARSEWVEAQVLFVYLDLDDMALFNHQYEVVADVAGGQRSRHAGRRAPGLSDRLSRDDLVEMIAYLRDPYVPANAYYINRAQFNVAGDASQPGLADRTGTSSVHGGAEPRHALVPECV